MIDKIIDVTEKTIKCLELKRNELLNEVEKLDSQISKLLRDIEALQLQQEQCDYEGPEEDLN